MERARLFSSPLSVRRTPVWIGRAKRQSADAGIRRGRNRCLYFSFIRPHSFCVACPISIAPPLTRPECRQTGGNPAKGSEFDSQYISQHQVSLIGEVMKFSNAAERARNFIFGISTQLIDSPRGEKSVCGALRSSIFSGLLKQIALEKVMKSRESLPSRMRIGEGDI